MKMANALVLFNLLLLSTKITADSRSQTVLLKCGSQLEHNSTIYVPNFVATMENISNQMRDRGYGQSVVGSKPDSSYGFAQCYGDLSSLDCVLCYAEARTVLPKCFPYNGGRIYLDGCFMRAENYSFFDEFLGPQDEVKCGNQSRKGQLFQESARKAVNDAVVEAPRNGGYARASVLSAHSRNESAYVLADCWKSLNSSSCKSCLENASTVAMRCLPWSEGRVLNTGCFLRYSDHEFLNPVQSSSRSKGVIVGVAVASACSVIIVVLGIMVGLRMWKQRKIERKRQGTNDAEKMASMLADSSLNFKYSTLEKATGGFNVAHKLGQGGFGTVYKGVLADGREVAVKRLFFNNKHRVANFYNEVNIISSLDHRNLVRLLGCSCLGPESLLVYEYLHNQSLDRFIFDPERGKLLNWEKRLEIIIGTVEGMVYLHENPKARIIHRDIKASNILLDLKLRPKIADFGLARSFQEDKSHISTAIAGTLGYMAPEYLAHGQLTEKADVYSFGVLLLEIVSGRQNNGSKVSELSESLVIEAWKLFQTGEVSDLMDPNLVLQSHANRGNIEREVLRVVHLAFLCLQENPLLRPPMSRILPMLSRMEDEVLPFPSNPPFMDEKTMELNDLGQDTHHLLNHTSSHASLANISHSSFYPR